MFYRALDATEHVALFAVGGAGSRPKGALASSNNKRKHMLPLSGTVGVWQGRVSGGRQRPHGLT